MPVGASNRRETRTWDHVDAIDAQGKRQQKARTKSCVGILGESTMGPRGLHWGNTRGTLFGRGIQGGFALE